MHYPELYLAKKRSPDEVISAVKSGDKVYTGGNPFALHKALYDRAGSLRDVKLYSMFDIFGASGRYLHSPELLGHISTACTTLPLASTRNLWPNEALDQISLSFSSLERLIENVIRPDAVLVRGCPMDGEGYINLGSNHGCARAAVDSGAKVLAQIDENAWSAYTDYHRIHISEVDMLCEFANPREDPVIVRTVGETDAEIAAHIVGRIPDGATVQLGAGGVANAMGTFLKDHKDLGIHAETIMESLLHLMESGVVTNSRKPLLRGVSVAGFVGGNDALQKFFYRNPDVLFKKLSWVNDPAVISRIPGMVSVNSCLGADLLGQVCAESIGMTNTGGIGGQLDFVEGARKSPGGQSFLAMHASVITRKGEKISKITVTLPPGSVVSTPACDVMNIVTEYGVAELWGKSMKERARSLIRIADPAFREDLTFEAKQCGLL